MRSNRKHLGLFSVILLLAATFGPLAAARAGDFWSFNLFGRPTALNIFSPRGESIVLTGAGVFCTGDPFIVASGAWLIFNGYDHPNGPIVRGTWHATGFVSFDGDELVITIATRDNDGTTVGTGELWVTKDGIAGPIYAAETWRVPAGGSGGGAKFHSHGKAP